MNRPEDILETEKYIEPLRFSTESESILFHSYLEWQNYARELEKKLEGQGEQFYCMNNEGTRREEMRCQSQCKSCKQ
jgi:hypothetical protein